MSDPLIIASIAAGGEPVRTEGAPASGNNAAGAQLNVGDVVAAKVVSVSPDGTVVLDLAGMEVNTSSATALSPGEMLALRIAALQPDLLLEILGDSQASSQPLAAALRTLVGGSERAAEQWQSLQADLMRLLDLPAGSPQGLSSQLVQQVLRGLSPAMVQPGERALPQALANLFSSLGFDLEALLQKAADGDTAALETAQKGLRALLGQLSQTLSQTPEAFPASTVGTVPPFAQVQQQVIQLLEQMQNQLLKALPQQLHARLGESFQTLQRGLPTLGVGPDPVGQVRAWLTNLRNEINSRAAQMEPEQRDTAQRETNLMINSLEEAFSRTENGRRIMQQIYITGAARNSEKTHERLNALQTLNAVFADGKDQVHLLFPVSILDELTEVQIKQFKHGKKGSAERGMTVVMLLELESLGRVRIDALLQNKALYCNLFVEKPEVSALVDALAPQFAEQVQARGLTLARLVCRVDPRTIEKFHTLHSEPGDGDAGMIDVRI